MELETIKRVSMEEQETTIVYSRDSKTAHVYTSDNTALTKIGRLLNAEGSEWKLKQVVRNSDGTPNGYMFECPKHLVSLRAKKTAKKMTDEQKEAARQRFVSYRLRQKQIQTNGEEIEE